MDHDRTLKSNRLRGLALMIERGECDADFTECAAPLAERRELIVRRVRALADTLEARGR